MIRKIYQKKLKAGALQYTIFISVVIALLVFSFISLTYVQNRLRVKASFYQEVVHTANQGFEYLSQHEIPYNELSTNQFLNENSPETTITKTHWGIFNMITITATKGKETFTKNALLGGHHEQKTALYLQDENQPLVVVGNTRIEGSTYLPEQGVKRGSIAGHSYTGTQLIYGIVARSNNKLPVLISKDYFWSMESTLLLKENNNFIELEENTKLINSFSESSIIISSINSIDLQYAELTGNIIIHSDVGIKVHPSVILKDVILIAPEVEILDKVEGNFQVFAEKRIAVGKDCKLNYPTALVLTEKEMFENTTTVNVNQEEHHIIIDKGANVRGVVAFISGEKVDTYKTQILIDENVVIVGEVYCDQNIELKGMVKGSVYTKGFIANQFGSVYKNHIYNGNIVSIDLPEQYSGLSFKNTKPTVAKWLY